MWCLAGLYMPSKYQWMCQGWQSGKEQASQEPGETVPSPRWISVIISSKGQLGSDVTYRGSRKGVRERMGQVESQQQQPREC